MYKAYVTYFDKDNNQVDTNDFIPTITYAVLDHVEKIKENARTNVFTNVAKIGLRITKDDKVIHDEIFDV